MIISPDIDDLTYSEHRGVKYFELVAEPVIREVLPGIFIRAPRIGTMGNKVKLLGRLQDEAVLIGNQNTLLATFHPELSGDPRIHQYFIRQFFL